MDNIFNVFLPLTFPYLHRVFILKGFGLCFPAIMISLLYLLSVSLPPLFLPFLLPSLPLYLPFLLPSLPSLSLSLTPSISPPSPLSPLSLTLPPLYLPFHLPSLPSLSLSLSPSISPPSPLSPLSLTLPPPLSPLSLTLTPPLSPLSLTLFTLSIPVSHSLSVCLSTLTRLAMHSHFPLSLSLYLSHFLKRRCAPLISPQFWSCYISVSTKLSSHFYLSCSC